MPRGMTGRCSKLCAVMLFLQCRNKEQGPIVDDTGFLKNGTHSVGVARQYRGQVGKQENCSVAVCLSITTMKSSLPICMAAAVTTLLEEREMSLIVQLVVSAIPRPSPDNSMHSRRRHCDHSTEPPPSGCPKVIICNGVPGDRC
jgi:hypothetical protein